ncbi:hypothetical protein PCE1_004920 [Barthelona sp. PCE]
MAKPKLKALKKYAKKYGDEREYVDYLQTLASAPENGFMFHFPNQMSEHHSNVIIELMNFCQSVGVSFIPNTPESFHLFLTVMREQGIIERLERVELYLCAGLEDVLLEFGDMLVHSNIKMSGIKLHDSYPAELLVQFFSKFAEKPNHFDFSVKSPQSAEIVERNVAVFQQIVPLMTGTKLLNLTHLFSTTGSVNAFVSLVPETLVGLNISACPIDGTTIETLKTLTGLTMLDVSKCQSSRVLEFFECTHLKNLYVNHNPVDKADLRALVQRLPTIQIQDVSIAYCGVDQEVVELLQTVFTENNTFTVKTLEISQINHILFKDLFVRLQSLADSKGVMIA